MGSHANPWPLLLGLLLLAQGAAGLLAEVNNIHNGYKFTVRGEPDLALPLPQLHLNQASIVENTLPHEQNIDQIIKSAGSKCVINLPQLAQATDLMGDGPSWVISTRWAKRPQYSVTFLLEGDEALSDKLFNVIGGNTLAYSEDL